MVDKSKTNQIVDGILNPVADENHQTVDTGEFGTTERIYKQSQGNLQSIADNPDTGEYLGIVLRVDGTSNATPSKSSLLSPSSIITSGILKEPTKKQPNLIQLRVRIPKIHSMLPIPEVNPSNFQKHPDNNIIDLYPVFVAKEENMDLPSAGDIVWVRFTNKSNNYSGLYTGVYKKEGYITESPTTLSPRKRYSESCPGVLSSNVKHSLGTAFPDISDNSPILYDDIASNGAGIYPKENIISSKATKQFVSANQPRNGRAVTPTRGICVGKQIAGYLTEDAPENMKTTTGAYQSYKNVPTKVELFTATPVAPPGWNIGSSKRPSGLLENRVRKFAFDALPSDSSLAVRLPQGGVRVHKLLANRINALNKFWTDTVLDKVPKSEEEKRKITGIWNSFSTQGGLRPQNYNDNYQLYQLKMLIEGNTGPDNKLAYSSLSQALSRKAFQSPHETGLAIDFQTNGQYSKDGGDQRERMNSWSWQWLVNHAWLFGLTPYSRETWHWELLPTREAWETGKDFVDVNDPTTGIWVGRLPDSQEERTKLYKKNPLLKEAASLDIPIYESIPYTNIGISGFLSAAKDDLYVLDKVGTSPMHFPYAVFVRETLLDESEDHGMTTSNVRWTFSTKYRKIKKTKKTYNLTVGGLQTNKVGEELISSKYRKYVIDKNKTVGSSLDIELPDEHINKKIYFGWSGNNE